jgi:hypothetical protein
MTEEGEEVVGDLDEREGETVSSFIEPCIEHTTGKKRKFIFM